MLPADDKGPVSVTKIIDGAELLIPDGWPFINKEDELARLAKEVAKNRRLYSPARRQTLQRRFQDARAPKR
ncbi:hypothetical protein KCP73_09065 [Salmonella enterica subsp. enterica]|nr:hypothetical protein KCP73_09065 [Salmonella enterica subsp. enterica]